MRLLSLIGFILLLGACSPAEQLPGYYGKLSMQTVTDLSLEPVASLYPSNHYCSNSNQRDCQAISLLDDWGWLPRGLSEQALAAALNQYSEDLLNADETYLGFSDDPWIIERLIAQANQIEIPSPSPLQNWLDQQVVANRLTGYNLSRITHAPNFKPEYSLYYGHSDLRHLRQLMALLKRQSLVAKVQLVPKRSVFVYLPEWGESSHALDTQPNGVMLARAQEYNLHLAFFDQQERSQFLDLIQTFAKRDTSGSTAVLDGSWWQPFIAAGAEATGFKQAYALEFISGDLTATAITIDNAIEFTTLPKPTSVSVQPVWLNPAFYRYLIGESHD